MPTPKNSNRDILFWGLLASGTFLNFPATLVIVICVINYLYGREQARQHPWETVLSSDQTFSHYRYTFLPPWTGFEIAILVIWLLGVLLIATAGAVLANSKKS